MNKQELARQYEPVLYFSRNGEGHEENFFPMSVDNFIADCRLYQGGEATPLQFPQGLTAKTLGQTPARVSKNYYLSYVADRFIGQTASWLKWFEDDGLVRFSVSEAPDEVEPEEAVSFGLMNEVAKSQQLPPDIITASIEQYRPYQDFSRYPPVYTYRVMNNRGFTVIQYWFFYAFNDWGTSHNGMNDHEGDWETVYVFLENSTPVYVAYAAHIGKPTTYPWSQVPTYQGSHPLVYVGCGSHASYIAPGIYKPVVGLTEYAQGNSQVHIGPGTQAPWGEPVDLSQQEWALNFAGNWGTTFRRFGSSAVSSGVQGPVGPAWQFDKWERPVWITGLG